MMRYGNAGGWMWAFGGVIMLGVLVLVLVLVLIVVAIWAMITVTERRDASIGGAPVANVDPAGSARTRQIFGRAVRRRRIEHRGLHRTGAHPRTLTTGL